MKTTIFLILSSLCFVACDDNHEPTINPSIEASHYASLNLIYFKDARTDKGR